MEKIAIFWYRRDLRLHDNAGLYHALKGDLPVLPLFIFDKNILDALEDKQDRRVTFIYQQIRRLSEELKNLGSSILVQYGKPEEVWAKILQQYEVKAVYTNHDYEPYAKERDAKVSHLLSKNNIPFYTFKDQTIFEKDEILKDDRKPYTVFTPYSRKWKKQLNDFFLKSYPNEKYFYRFLKISPLPLIHLQEMGFVEADYHFPSSAISQELLVRYGESREFPAIQGTSRISVHLRFGTVSIRELARKGLAYSEKWLNELIWRDFYMMILWHFPHSAKSAFNPAYNHIEWINNEKDFEAWCKGETGYPIVDAGMRELNETGFMHNRVRMITACFLTKHLLIDWRWGEAYFAKKLIDFELSSNNGGWQWASGSGCDAAPYFRIFNPTLQAQKFDKDFQYIRKWVPEFSQLSYPKPIINHEFARDRALEVYKKGLGRA
ncbi:cryptochrome/photolyase family protein [Thermoflexibacter ruber]|uniref:Deoxyribodipyrimidine photo-lyase n=1 Tax=Thermoflexibacter ruber TaxID=1003 RepID=A0A1I2CPN3_9BACT|nr:deoxyribodipyrimidine photo-lyase [Thermoflexibacter ruber]SFE70246.1 deoxyribodipyrimidine photo-lyase [Thermoflexibacter ruber]